MTTRTQLDREIQRTGAQWALRDYRDACRVIADPRASRREIDEAKAEASNAARHLVQCAGRGVFA